MDILELLSEYKTFSFVEFVEVNKQCGSKVGEAAMRKKLQKHLKNEEIIRVGRGLYAVSNNNCIQYSHVYSDDAIAIASKLKDNHPFLNFTIFELTQLNEFVNHQIAHNVFFVFVDGDVMDFVFDTLNEFYQGKVLLSPTLEIYHQYWSDNMIVILKLITESPKGINIFWHTRLEKLLVDLLAENLISECISESEYSTIFSDSFKKYIVDESCLFRYAKRRHAAEKIETLLNEETEIELRTKGNYL